MGRKRGGYGQREVSVGRKRERTYRGTSDVEVQPCCVAGWEAERRAPV